MEVCVSKRPAALLSGGILEHKIVKLKQNFI